MREWGSDTQERDPGPVHGTPAPPTKPNSTTTWYIHTVTIRCWVKKFYPSVLKMTNCRIPLCINFQAVCARKLVLHSALAKEWSLLYFIYFSLHQQALCYSMLYLSHVLSSPLLLLTHNESLLDGLVNVAIKYRLFDCSFKAHSSVQVYNLYAD